MAEADALGLQGNDQDAEGGRRDGDELREDGEKVGHGKPLSVGDEAETSSVLTPIEWERI
jgi:hypothetical protein